MPEESGATLKKNLWPSGVMTPKSIWVLGFEGLAAFSPQVVRRSDHVYAGHHPVDAFQASRYDTTHRIPGYRCHFDSLVPAFGLCRARINCHPYTHHTYLDVHPFMDEQYSCRDIMDCTPPVLLFGHRGPW
jgi:hypothetical protein